MKKCIFLVFIVQAAYSFTLTYRTRYIILRTQQGRYVTHSCVSSYISNCQGRKRKQI